MVRLIYMASRVDIHQQCAAALFSLHMYPPLQPGADSRPHNAAFLEAQNAALQHLAAHAVAAPVPQPAADGAYLAFELLPHPSGKDTQGKRAAFFYM